MWVSAGGPIQDISLFKSDGKGTEMAFRSRVVVATQLASFCGMLNYLSHSKTDHVNKALSFSERIHFVLQKDCFVLWWKCAPAAWFFMYRGAYEYVSGIISNLGDASLPQEPTAINITAKTSLSETLVCSVCVWKKKMKVCQIPFRNESQPYKTQA